jgi:preprotein translocase subunit SecD
MTRRVVGLIIVLAIAWGGLAAAVSSGLTPRLGLDLQGGTAVVLTAPPGTDPDLVVVATDIMNRRIEDIGGVQEPDIQISGDDTVVVQLPGVEDEQRAIEAVGQTGLLSFRPVLDAVTGEIGPLAGTGTPNIDDVTGPGCSIWAAARRRSSDWDRSKWQVRMWPTRFHCSTPTGRIGR